MARRRYFVGFMDPIDAHLWVEVTSAYYHDSKRFFYHKAHGFEWQTFSDKSEQWYTRCGDAGCTTVDGLPPFGWAEGTVKMSVPLLAENRTVEVV